jgi:hypothetical protein
MSFELTLQIVQALAVVVGVGFGLVQLHQIRVQREAQGGVELLRSMQAPQTASTALLLYELPDNLSRAELKARLSPAELTSVLWLASMFESMGPLIARGHVPLDLYAEYYRGGTIICWRKLQGYAEDQRADGYSNLFEWFQWLAERLEDNAPFDDDRPAHIAFKDWRAPADYAKLRGVASGRN